MRAKDAETLSTTLRETLLFYEGRQGDDRAREIISTIAFTFAQRFSMMYPGFDYMKFIRDCGVERERDHKAGKRVRKKWEHAEGRR